MEYVQVIINGKVVEAQLLEEYPDGDVRVRYAGREYVVKPQQQVA